MQTRIGPSWWNRPKKWHRAGIAVDTRSRATNKHSDRESSGFARQNTTTGAYWRTRLSDLDALTDRYRRDPESVYHTWFLHDANRLKAFRSIRRGVEEVVRAVRGGTFGTPLDPHLLPRPT